MCLCVFKSHIIKLVAIAVLAIIPKYKGVIRAGLYSDRVLHCDMRQGILIDFDYCFIMTWHNFGFSWLTRLHHSKVI